MTPDTKNLVAAASLSMMVLIGWQLYFVEPELEAQRDQYNQAQQADDLPSASQNEAASTASLLDAPARPDDNAKRISISTPLMQGSLTTKGARIDDVTLTSYRETLEDDAQNITLLHKISDETPYFAEFGWIGDSGDIALPDAQTIWTADSEKLSPSNDVTLRWDNGQGLVFSRTIAVDDQYMMTITDEVTSAVDETLRLLPYGLVRRFGTPDISDIYILHEGPIGVVDETLKERSYGDLQDEISEFESEEDGGWIGITDKYWLTALIPDQSQKATLA